MITWRDVESYIDHLRMARASDGELPDRVRFERVELADWYAETEGLPRSQARARWLLQDASVALQMHKTRQLVRPYPRYALESPGIGGTVWTARTSDLYEDSHEVARRKAEQVNTIARNAAEREIRPLLRHAPPEQGELVWSELDTALQILRETVERVVRVVAE